MFGSNYIYTFLSFLSSQQCVQLVIDCRMADNVSLASSSTSSSSSDNLSSELDLDSLESDQDDIPRTQNLRAHMPSRQPLPVEPTVIPTSFTSFRPSINSIRVSCV